MGIIDSNKFKITCLRCEAEERAAVHQKGSVYGASWQRPPALRHFSARWRTDTLVGPVIAQAICGACDIPALVETH